ncbi:MAG: 3-methyl-2-oxobutanoate hydroxymethyltransferase, partial [uncultured Chloroflexia bacterium]
ETNYPRYPTNERGRRTHSDAHRLRLPHGAD